MPKFNICIERLFKETAEFEIDANDRDDAAEIVQGMIDNDDEVADMFTQEGIESEDISITEIEE